MVPLTVSLKLMAASELGFEAYAVGGLGVNLTSLRGGSVTSTDTSRFAYHAGLGVRRMLGASLYAGLEGRYVFQDAGRPLERLDGLRLSALAGASF
jgi:opacity protein-like surface antigen